MANEEQKPDQQRNSRQPDEPAEAALGKENGAAGPTDLVDRFADDDLASYEPRGPRPGAGRTS